MKTIGHWIDGATVHGSGDRRGPIWNPASGQQQAEVDFATPSEVDRVVASAKIAQAAWRSTSLSRRAGTLFRLRELLSANTKAIAELITAENGKVLTDAIGEVARGIENVEYACGVPNLLKGGYSEQVSSGVDVYSIRQPVGVIVGITPFNFPAMVPMWMLANGVACGNAFILKPSEKAPSAALLLGELFQRAGLPDGCFNIVNGDRETANALITHPDVDAVSFVGSTAVAKSVYENATRHGKRVQALGGAKNHMLVLADADLEIAADAAVNGAYGAAGERCMAVSVVLASDAVASELVSHISARLAKLNVGPGQDPDSDMGPLISAEHRTRVMTYLESAHEDGATIVVDGREAAARTGFFLNPSLIDYVKPGMRCYDDEIFGPVLSIVRVASLDEAIETINANQYGNGATIFTSSGSAARRFQSEVNIGMVGVNVPIPVPAAYYSFGGWKASLFGDQHMYGPDGINFSTRNKVVTSRWPEAGSSRIDLGFPEHR